MTVARWIALAATAFVFSAPSLALADGDASHGKKVFNKCKACHSPTPGKHLVGPSLFGIYGATAGKVKGFKKYRHIAKADWVWDAKSLDEYLTDPRKFMTARLGKPGIMVLKLPKRDDREDVIAYLKTLK